MRFFFGWLVGGYKTVFAPWFCHYYQGAKPVSDLLFVEEVDSDTYSEVAFSSIALVDP